MPFEPTAMSAAAVQRKLVTLWHLATEPATLLCIPLILMQTAVLVLAKRVAINAQNYPFFIALGVH